MYSTRLAALVLATGLLTLSGCCCWPCLRLCHRGNGCGNGYGNGYGNSFEAGASPVVGDGPILGSPSEPPLPLAPIPRTISPNAQTMPYTP